MTSNRSLSIGAAAGLLLAASPVGAQVAGSEGPETAVQSEASREPSDTESLEPALESATLPRRLAPFQADWGIAAVVRTAQIPFATQNESVSSFVPMMFYEGEHVFVRGLDAGLHAWEDEDSELNLVTKLRFVDIPSEFQNQIQGDTADVGLQWRQDMVMAWWEAEAFSDPHGEWYVGGRIGSSAEVGDLLFTPSVEVRYLSSGFNERYYALTRVTGQQASGAFQVSPNVIGRYHVWRDLYLLGSLRYTWFSNAISDLDAIDDSGVAEAMLGFGFFQDAGDAQFLGEPRVRTSMQRSLEAKPYVRTAHGWATESDLGEILRGDITNDEYDNQMSSVFYGHPLTDTLFGAPIEVYLSPGLAYHYESAVQDSTPELVLKIKAYYTVHWPVRWRLGAAEGISWIDEVTYIENENMISKGYRPSQLMNYLDFSLDINVGDIFGVDGWDRLWAGVAVHHRSSIFESASQFGRISGGSNYPSVYLQYDLY